MTRGVSGHTINRGRLKGDDNINISLGLGYGYEFQPHSSPQKAGFFANGMSPESQDASTDLNPPAFLVIPINGLSVLPHSQPSFIYVPPNYDGNGRHYPGPRHAFNPEDEDDYYHQSHPLPTYHKGVSPLGSPVNFKLNPSAGEFTKFNKVLNPYADEFTPGASFKTACEKEEGSDDDGGWELNSFSEIEDSDEGRKPTHVPATKEEIVNNGLHETEIDYLFQQKLNLEAKPFFPPTYTDWNVSCSEDNRVFRENEIEQSSIQFPESYLFKVEDEYPIETKMAWSPQENENYGMKNQQPHEQFQNFIKFKPAPSLSTPFPVGQTIPFYFVEPSEAKQFPELDITTMSFFREGPTKNGIPLFVPPELQTFTNTLAKLPEPLRVVQPTIDAPYTRVYGLGGFEPKSTALTMSKPEPSLSIGSYLSKGHHQQHLQQQEYEPSYGFLGFTGSSSALILPNGTFQTEHVIVPEYDLVYGVIGYVPLPPTPTAPPQTKMVTFV